MKFRLSVSKTETDFEFFNRLDSILMNLTVLQSMMDQMINQLKSNNWVETWEVLTFQALGIPYLSNLNQIIVLQKMDFLQQSIMVIHI